MRVLIAGAESADHVWPKDSRKLASSASCSNASQSWVALAIGSTIAGYRRTEQDTLFYLTAESQKVDAKVNQFSAETRLTSNGDGRLRWLLGLFALNEAQNYVATFESFPSEPLSLGNVMIRPVGPAVLNWPSVTDLTAAVFTQETFSFTEHFRATARLACHLRAETKH